MKPERTKEEILNEAAREYARDHSAAPDKETPDWIIDDFKAGARWQESQSSPVESNRKIEIAIAEFERLKSLAGTLRDIIYLDGVLAVLDTIKNDQFVPPIEETKEK